MFTKLIIAFIGAAKAMRDPSANTAPPVLG